MSTAANNDAEYLKQTVGLPLQMALTALVVAQPVDAIEFIGSYLVAHVEKEESKEARGKRFEYLDEACALKEKSQAASLATAEAEAKAKGPTEAEAELETLLTTTSDVESLYPRLLDAVKRAGGGTSCYAAKKDVVTGEDGSSLICLAYCAATEGCDMTGKFFIKGQAAEDEGVEEESGATLDLFKQRGEYETELTAADELIAEATAKVEDAKSSAATATEEQAASEEAVPVSPALVALEEAVTVAETELATAEKAKSAVLQFPPRVFVENVAREPRVKFFGVPQIGSFLALPVRYDSALHSEGVGELIPVIPPPTVEEQEEGAEVAEPVAVVVSDKEREPLNTASLIKKEVVVAVHTMGQLSVVVTPAQMAACEVWTTKLAEAHRRADAEAWRRSALLREDAALKAGELEVSIAELDAAEELKLASALEELTGEPMEKAVLEKKEKLASAWTLVNAYLNILELLAKDDIPPPLAALKVLRAALGLAGVSLDSTAELGTNVGSWQKTRSLMTEKLLPFFLAADCDFLAVYTADATGEKRLPVPLDGLREMAQDLDMAELLSSHFAGSAIAKIQKWTTYLFALYDDVKAEAIAKAEAAAEAAAAAAADEE